MIIYIHRTENKKQNILKGEWKMGLDSYLKRMPRYGNTTPSEISAIESYMDWRQQKENKTYKE